jgi:group I intron endonuclease
MIIYKITNSVNGKVYIGLSTKTLKERRSTHKQDFLSGKKIGYKLYKAFAKYGFESFSWEVIDVALSSDELKDKERFWIKEYNSFNVGYNMTLGGDYNPREGIFGKDNNQSKKYIITHKDGSEEVILGLKHWCRERSLNKGGFYNVMAGTVKSYKGMTIRTFND